MKDFYFAGLLLVAGPIWAQSTQPAITTVSNDTIRRPFRGDLPDSLALVPTPGALLQLQGQDQPVRPFLTIQDQLRTVAGVQVTPYDGSPGSSNVVRIRGASVAQGMAQPLYVIDGLPALNDELTPGQSFGVFGTLPPSPLTSPYAYQLSTAAQQAEVGASPLQLLPPDAIERVEVLAGPAAVARYGPLAANGVISIQTRRGRTGRPIRVRYAAHVGVQQVRQRYDLLSASEYAVLSNEAAQRAVGAGVVFPNTNLGTGTDWQAETYRLAGLQQHQLSLDGAHANTAYLIALDYRRQSGVLQTADLTRLGLRLALDQRIGARLRLHGTATLGQTDQRLPYTLDNTGVVRAALTAPPTQPVRTGQGAYSGYDYTSFQPGPGMSFANPLAIADYTYRTPRTRRLLTQLAADYEPLPYLTVRASANFQRTLLSADSYMPLRIYTPGAAAAPPSSGYSYATQVYRASQWAAQLAVRYQRALGTRHSIGLEVDYQYQASNFMGRQDYFFGDRNNLQLGYSGGDYEENGAFRLHRPWAHLTYAFDSTLTVEAGLSYGHYREIDRTEYYPNAQLSWQPHRGHLSGLRLWVGAARTSTLGMGYGASGPARLVALASPIGFYPAPDRRQSPLTNDQIEAGLQVASSGSHLTAQLVAYQRTSHHALLMQNMLLSQASGFTTFATFNEATIRNQGLDLTLTGTWQRGRLQGTTRLVGSLNRNRLRENDVPYPLNPAFANLPTGTQYGYQQDGLNSDGTLRFRRANATDRAYERAVLGTGIPPQLASLSQQLRRGRLALDAQVDGMFGYQVVNYQRQFLDTPTGYTNNATTVRDRWTPTNQNTSIPAANLSTQQLYSTDGSAISSRLIESGTNVRLSSLTLTYRLRQTATQDISLWVGAQNLFVLTSYRGYDPNVSSGGAAPTLAGLDYGAVPVPRTWLAGVRAEF